MGSPTTRPPTEKTLRDEVAGVVRKQADVGIDIVSDGEYGKAGWIRYVAERLGGFDHRPIRPGDREHNPVYLIREAKKFPRILRRLYADPVLRLAAARSSRRRRSNGVHHPLQNLWVWECVAPITYKGQDAIGQDIDNFKAALKGVNVDWTRSCRSPRR